MAGKRRSRRAFGSVKRRGKRHYAEYTGPDGKRHTPGGISFATVTDADGWLAAEKRLIDLGTWQPPALRQAKASDALLTVGEWITYFHDRLERGPHPLKASTLQQYRRVIRNRILKPYGDGAHNPDVTFLASVTLYDLDRRDVYRWWDGINASYPGQHTQNQHAYTRLRAAMADAVEREIIDRNPVEVKEAGKKIERKDKYLPSDQEIDRILQAVPDNYRLATSLMLHHGLRIGEALALEQRHVDIEYLPVPYMPRVTVTVDQNAQRIKGSDGITRMVVQPPKTKASRRQVPIMAKDVPLVLAHLARHVPEEAVIIDTSTGPRRAYLLTCTSTQKIVMDTSYRSILERAEQRAGVSTKIDPHCGRNWLITRLAEKGAHLKEIGRLLGQDDVTTILDVYMKVRAGRTTELMEVVNASLEA